MPSNSSFFSKKYLMRVAFMVTFCPMYSAHGATEGSAAKASATVSGKKTHVSSGKASKIKSTAAHSTARLGVGVGIQNLYLPVCGVELIIGLRNFTISPEFGYLKFSQADFSGQVMFVGLDGRWIFAPGKPLFLGLTTGLRTVDVTTNANVEYSSAGNSSVTTVAWHRHISQMIVNPRVGWIWAGRSVHGNGRGATAESSDMDTLGQGGAFSLALGLLIPFASKSTISGSPNSVSGVSDEQYQSQAAEKLKDVSSKTNGILPTVEIKYMYFLL